MALNITENIELELESRPVECIAYLVNPEFFQNGDHNPHFIEIQQKKEEKSIYTFQPMTNLDNNDNSVYS